MIGTQSFNSLGQNPCLVLAHLMATCYGGTFTVDPLLVVGDSYSPPTKEKVQQANSCWCSTVILSLLSACGECQFGLSTSWTEWSQNCTGTVEISTFPNPVPVATRVPRWALLDITLANFWNATAAQIVGDTPEILQGAPIEPSSGSGSGTNTAAIAGGVTGGALAIAAVVGLVFAFWRRRRRWRAEQPSATPVVEGAPPPPLTSHLGQVHPASSYSHMSVSQTMSNGANDTIINSHQQGVLTSTSSVNAPVASYNEYLNGNNPTTNMQPLRLPVQGYHGLPTV
ncbi:hypothetical protein H4582DRAFT_1952181 [Lactarius indigo]|nr:hypothetical protein H4582DRAFT_1952181 [Lactarius indigo]